MAAVEPEAKRQKTEASEPPPPELETDAKPSKSAALGREAGFELQECTLNVIPSVGGRVLMPLTDCGMQFLIGGARANVGVKKGRYLYEVKLLESHSQNDSFGRQNRQTVARNLVKLGFSTQDSPLLLGETDQSVFFDSEGNFTAEMKSEKVSQRFSRDQTLAVLLNLDSSSPNKNTLSLFRDGVRISQPQKLPESLIGKALFPHVSFKNMTLHVNFGPPLVPLPFKCFSISEVTKADGQEGPSPPKDGKYEVVLPVGLPEEGAFDWLDGFLQKHPNYCELSDRAIVKWAEKSGVTHNRNSSWKSSNDKPTPQFGIQPLDDFSIRRVITAVAATQPRNYVVMELKSNLVKEERSAILKRFSEACFKPIAEVVMGEPPADFKAAQQKAMLTEKQEKAEMEWKARKLRKEQEKQMKARQKELEEAKKKAMAAAEVKKEEETAEGEKKESEEKKDGEGDVEMKEEGAEMKKEEDTEMKVKEEEEEKKVEGEPEEPDEPCPVAELTAEEKAMNFQKKAVPDVAPWVVASQLAKFSLPDKEEGFDDVRFAWSKVKASKDHMQKWILKQKILCRIEDLKEGEWFKTKFTEWTKVLGEWQAKQKEFQANPPAAATAAPVEEKKEEGEAKEADAEGEKKDEEKRESEGEGEAKAENKPEKVEVTDVMAVEDVCNADKAGEPLFAKFSFEDWTLLNLRSELHHLVHAFKKDADDPERVGIHEQHLTFYFNKYFKKQLSLKFFGVESNKELLSKFLKDTVTISDESEVFVPQLGDDLENFDIFVKLTEVARRERQEKIDGGDAAAALKFEAVIAAPPPAPAAPAHGGYQKGGFKGDKGGFKGDKGGFKGGGKDFKGGFKGDGFKGGFKGDGFKGDFGGKGFKGDGFKGDKGFGKKGGFDGGKGCFGGKGGFKGGYGK